MNNEQFIPTRHSLLSRLKDWNDQDSWRVFFDTYWKLIYQAAIRAGLSDSEAQDVVQETVISVSKSFAKSAYDPTKGPFKAWLMRLTTWRILGQLRKRQPVTSSHPLASEDSEPDLLEQIPDEKVATLEAHWDEEWERNLLEVAIQRVKAKVDAKHFQIFDLYVRKSWPVGKVACDMKVTSAMVYLIKHRVSNLLKNEINYLRTKPI